MISKSGNRFSGFVAGAALRGEIGYHGIEHQEALRRRPHATFPLLDEAKRLEMRETLGRELASDERGETFGRDPLGEAKPHQQELIPFLLSRKDLALDHAMPVRQHAPHPGFGAFLGRKREPAARRDEPPVRAGAHADIVLATPVDQVVPAAD